MTPVSHCFMKGAIHLKASSQGFWLAWESLPIPMVGNDALHNPGKTLLNPPRGLSSYSCWADHCSRLLQRSLSSWGRHYRLCVRGTSPALKADFGQVVLFRCTKKNKPVGSLRTCQYFAETKTRRKFKKKLALLLKWTQLCPSGADFRGILFSLGFWHLFCIISGNSTMKFEKLCEKPSKKLERNRVVKRWRGKWKDFLTGPFQMPHICLPLPVPLWRDGGMLRKESCCGGEVPREEQERSGATIDEELASGNLDREAASVHPASGTQRCHCLHRCPWQVPSHSPELFNPRVLGRRQDSSFLPPPAAPHVPDGQPQGTGQCCETWNKQTLFII